MPAESALFLDGILERNAGFVRGRTARPLPPVETPPLAVVACYDPRLDELVLPSLGLGPGHAFLLRTAGAVVPPGGDPMRSLALAVFLFGVSEILIVGHTSCRMAMFSSTEFIDSFRGRGVPREAFGDGDLRAWTGAISDPRRGVLVSVSNVLAAPFLPRDLALAGAVLDDTTGALELVFRPGDSPAFAGADLSAPAAPEPAVTSGISGEPEPRESPAESAAPMAEQASGASDPLIPAMAAFLDAATATGHWRGEADRLRAELGSTKDPAAKFRLLDGFARRVTAESREAAAAFQKLRQAATAAGTRRGPGELAEIFHRLLGAAGRGVRR